MQIIWAAGATWCEIFCWIYPKIYLFLLIANISSKYFIRTFQQNVTSKCKTAAPVQIIWAAGRPGADINNLFHTGRGTRGSFPGDDNDDDDDEDTGDKSYQKKRENYKGVYKEIKDDDGAVVDINVLFHTHNKKHTERLSERTMIYMMMMGLMLMLMLIIITMIVMMMMMMIWGLMMMLVMTMMMMMMMVMMMLMIITIVTRESRPAGRLELLGGHMDGLHTLSSSHW